MARKKKQLSDSRPWDSATATESHDAAQVFSSTEMIAPTGDTAAAPIHSAAITQQAQPSAVPLDYVTAHAAGEREKRFKNYSGKNAQEFKQLNKRKECSDWIGNSSIGMSSRKGSGNSSGSSSEERDDLNEDGDEIELRVKNRSQVHAEGDFLSEYEREDNVEKGELGSEDSEEDGDIEASFGFFDPQEDDEEEILSLLRQSRITSHLQVDNQALRPLATVISEQANVGSVLKTVGDADSNSVQGVLPQEKRLQEAKLAGCSISRSRRNSTGTEDKKEIPTQSTQPQSEDETSFETTLGFLTILSLQQYAEATAPFVSAILKFAGQYASARQRSDLAQLLAAKEPLDNSGCAFNKNRVNCGWLVKERISNTPTALIPQMYDSLVEDIAWSLSTEKMDEKERPFYSYTHIFLVTRFYKEKNFTSSSIKKQKTVDTLPEGAIFPHPEDEVLMEASTLSFVWPTGHSARVSKIESEHMSSAKSASGREGSYHTATPSQIQSCPEYQLFMLLPFEKFKTCVKVIAARASEGGDTNVPRENETVYVSGASR